jgi:hypothetical protein
VLTQISEADNSGASVIIRDFHPRRLVVPLLRTRAPMEKTMPATLALAESPAETWREGQNVNLEEGIEVEVLGPAPDSADNHAQDRSLVLLFQAAGHSLLWAGKIETAVQQKLLTDHPTLQADLLVLSPDSAPADAWLRSLGVREWLQIPRRERGLNAATSEDEALAPWGTWPLDKTGAVQVQFEGQPGTEPGKIIMRPWVDVPERP